MSASSISGHPCVCEEQSSCRMRGEQQRRFALCGACRRRGAAPLLVRFVRCRRRRRARRGRRHRRGVPAASRDSRCERRLFHAPGPLCLRRLWRTDSMGILDAERRLLGPARRSVPSDGAASAAGCADLQPRPGWRMSPIGVYAGVRPTAPTCCAAPVGRDRFEMSTRLFP